VHTHGAKSGFLGRLSAWFCNVPVIVHTFHGHFFHSYFSERASRFIAGIERQTAKITTAAVALSVAQKKDLVEKYKILPAPKVVIIPLGFACELHDKNYYRNAFRIKYGLKNTDIAIGIVGRIVPIKNHLFFVRVIKNILSSNASSTAAFFIIGDGSLRHQIEDELIKAAILFSDEKVSSETRVIFTSWITDIYQIMNGLDIVTLTSLNEGTPLSIIEAQFFKKPVVSTDVGGVKDILENGKTGFVIQKDNEEAFCEKITELITDEDLRVRMGEEGFKLAEQRFSKQKEVERTKEFYFSLLNRKTLKSNPK
jgi:glycosyltransferase involved in cell wall biosynthesis